MNMLPTNIEVASARLPETYEQAKLALTSCERIDECWEWANKAEALASYAKMADDDSLRVLADRIQARAVRRMGELLKEYDGRGGDQSRKRDAPLSAEPSRREAAERAGLSPDQQKQAVRVANVPAAEFEAAIEQPAPPTVTALAEMGKVSRTVPPESFKKATHLIGTVKRFAEFCQENEPVGVAAGVTPTEVVELRKQVDIIDGWLDRLPMVGQFSFAARRGWRGPWCVRLAPAVISGMPPTSPSHQNSLRRPCRGMTSRRRMAGFSYGGLSWIAGTPKRLRRLARDCAR